MSAKSSKKPKAKAPVPRPKAQIEEDYGRVVSQLGQVTYQADVYREEIARLNANLRNLNYEAAARNQLDRQEAELKAAAAPQPAPAETPAPESKQ